MLIQIIHRTLCGSSESGRKIVFWTMVVGIILVKDVTCKKFNATSTVSTVPSSVPSQNYYNYTYVTSSSMIQPKNESISEKSSIKPVSAVGTGRQSSSYGAPASGGNSGGYVAAGGGYDNPQYAIPPIVLQHGGGGWGMSSGGMTGGGWGADDDDDSDGGDLKGLLGLLGLAGLKGLKPLKAVKALKGLGLLALSPLLLPLLPLLLLLPLALLILPLLLLLLIPIPVISIPGGRRKRDLSGNGQIQTHKTLLQETMDDIISQIPQDFASLQWKDVDQCMDKFICDTGVMVSRVAPSMATPAAWLLAKLWPEPLQSKVETFRKVTEMLKNKKSHSSFPDVKSRNSFYNSYNLHPAKHSKGICAVNYKCRVKKLENLFHSLVVQQTGKLKERLMEKIPPGQMSAANIFKALLT